MHKKWIAVAALVALVPAVAQADGEKHCGLLMASSLAMHFDDAGRPLVPTSIDGKDEAMLVDTGGAYSMVTGETAKALDLRIALIDPGMYYMGWNGQTLSQTATAQSVAIGRIKFAHPRFLILPTGFGNVETAGTISPDIMHRFDVEFDFAGAKLNFFSQDHCDGKVVYWANDYAVLPFRSDVQWAGDDVLLPSNSCDTSHIMVDATLDGQAVKVLVDTGSSTSWMTLDAAHRLFGLDAAALERIGATKSVNQTLYAYPFKTLDLQGVSVHNPKIVLTADKL